jgi:hypothetical protein
MKNTDTLMTPGDLAAPPGSREWAIAVRTEIQLALKDTTRRAEDLEIWVRGMESNRGYLQLPGPDGDPFASFEEFCCAKPPWGVGYDRKLIEQIIAERKDAQTRANQAGTLLDAYRPPKHSNKGNNITLIKTRGTGADYRTARIARDRPDILKRMKAGEFKSVNAAAIAAGFVHPPPALKELLRIWRKASPDERQAFVNEHLSEIQILCGMRTP